MGEKANATYGVYQEQVETKKRLEAENINIEEEKKALVKQLESEQGNLGEYTERQAKASAQKADLEVQLAAAGQQLIDMEQARQQATGDKKTLEQDNILSRRILKIWNWLFKSWSKKKQTGTTLSG